MGYLIGAVLVIVLIILIVRLIVHVLAWTWHWLASVAHAIGHAASVTGGFLATVTPRIAIGVTAAGLLWLAAWLAAEVRYFLRDSRRERRWFEAIAPRIAVAMAPGGAYTVASLVAPPRSPALGRSADHPLTLPIPRSLQRLADRGTRAAGLSIAVPSASRPADDDASRPGSGGFAAGPSAMAQRVAPRAGRYPVAPGSSQRIPAPESLNRLPTLAQLDRVRELVDAGARVSVSMRAVAEEVAGPDRKPGPADGPGKGRVIVKRSDGVLVGRDNRQYNFYTYKVVTPRLADLAKRLSDPDVVAAARRLGADPENAADRRALLAKLAPGGLPLGGPTSELHITALRARTTRSGSWLDGTVLFRDVSNGQIGNANTQRNEFIYAVAPNRSARELLASNRELAKALIDCAFPAHGRGDTAPLSRALTSVIERTPVVPGDGRIRSQHYDLPGAGQTLRIQAHDGVSVGPRSTVTRTDIVVAGPASGIVREPSPYDIATRGKLRGAVPEPPGRAPEPHPIPHPGEITRRGPGIGRMGP
jgi:hypothetical protein